MSKKTGILPFGDRVLVRRAAPDSITKSGLVIPDTAKEKPKRGTVIAVGQGMQYEDGSWRKIQLKAGDEIIFGAYAANEIRVDNEDLLIVNNCDVLAVVSTSSNLN